MTTALQLANIADSIAAISIAGVTVKDKDQVSGSFEGVPNVLFPYPEGWITDFNIEFVTNLRGATAPADITYSLHYRFLGSLLGDLGSLPKAYSDLVDKLLLVINAMVANDAPYSGKVDMALGGVEIGARPDPVGNMYNGADITLRITEQQN